MTPNLETLEPRHAPSGLVVQPIALVNGVLTVHAPNQGGTVLVTRASDRVVVLSGPVVGVFATADVHTVVLAGSKHNDTLINQSGLHGVFAGLGGHDILIGAQDDLFIDAAPPDDIVLALAAATPITTTAA